MSQKKYWGNFGQLNETEAFKQTSKDEFREDLLPLEDLDNGLLQGKTPRRDFLKYLGFSTAAAALAASCNTPVRNAVPYLSRPDDIVPGVAQFYASTYVNGGETISVLVKQRDGRPIKIEGNDLSAITKGGTSARSQASVLDLYDTSRLRHPLQKSGNDFKEVTSFEAIDKMILQAMSSVSGSIVLLTSTINSPSTLKVIEQFLAKYPGSRHVQYDAVSYSGMLLANEMSYGKRYIPSYNFEKAKTIVSLGADFLGTWLSPVEFSSQYATNRRIKKSNPALSRHIQFESMLTLTGSNADDRFTHKPSETGAVALAILAKLNGSVSAPSISDANLAKGIDKAVAALNNSKGEALVVSGSNDVNIQMIVNAINEAIGASGSTIDHSVSSNYKKGIDADMASLLSEMKSGKVGALFIHDCNPVYSYFDGGAFAQAMSKTALTVSFNSTMDETTELCRYIVPSHHWLESWGDAEPKSGYFSFIQPVINPLFKTRQFQSSLLSLAGGNTAPNNVGDTLMVAENPPIKAYENDSYEIFFKNFWISKLGSNSVFETALQEGLVQPASVQSSGNAIADTALAVTSAVNSMITAKPTFNSASVSSAQSGIGSAKGGNVEIVFYEKVGIGNGSQANNPWLQELPDPVTKVTWDNYAMISPQMAKSLLGIDVMNNKKQGDDYEVHPEKPVIKITVNGRSVSLPAMIIPGVHPSTIAVAVGYGRQSSNKDQSIERIGRSATNAGQNVYPLISFSGVTLASYFAGTAEKTGDKYALAQTQVHGFSENRPVIYETTLSDFKKDPKHILRETKEELEGLIAGGSKDFVKDATIYPDYVKPGVKWGMSIDLNTCTGCSACVIACNAENNISVVGKKEVARYHDMHWMRIDRYFTGNDPLNPEVVFQPMLCQHCDNAPCENVCPVAATNHSSEGLNQMAYNRCIGTRYCANNCPYKVRRFNWLDYNGADSFPNNQKPIIGSYLNEVTEQMNDDLTRMVLNPDVTVRSRGVMEKCSFCVQRLQDGKLEAKKTQNPAVVRNLKTACAQACPTNAITFGNVNDSKSDVFKIRNVEQTDRSFYVLQQLHTLPNINYLAKIRNTDRNIGVMEEEAKKEHS